jgi:hypothetical protein
LDLATVTRHGAMVLTCMPRSILFSECNAANETAPTVYVKIHFSISWNEMCHLGDYLKQSISKEIVMNDNTGQTLPANKIVLYNFAKHCPKGSYVNANVYIFASNVSGSINTSDIDEDMTKQIYKVLHYYHKQDIERYLGSIFIGKVKVKCS